VDTNQFAELVAAVARSLPRDMNPTVAQGWITNQRALASNLRQALCPPQGYELYLHSEQKRGGSILGFDLEKHLEDEGLIERAFSLESPLVKLWLEKPETYPEELKNKVVFLWGSGRTAFDARQVADLVWGVGRVCVSWRWLGYRWLSNDPALLEPKVE
jgi:hypothetical protein